MGAGQAIWLRDGQEMNAEFGEVVTCSVHGQFAGTATHIPGNGPQPEDDMVNLIAFSDCSLINESSGIEALAAHRQWGAYLAENGSDNFMGAMFPVAGENPGAEYDYKSIVNFPSAEAWGNHLGTMIPGGLQRAGQIFGRVTQCDTPRVYTTMTVREMAQG